jgi:hypothetical protein
VFFGRSREPFRDPALYYFSIFGEPAGSAPWGWRLEGHHLSLNYTVVDGDGVAHSPSFFGANPATVRSGALTGLRALGPEEDLARELVRSFDPARRKRAIFADRAPSEIVNRRRPPRGPDRAGRDPGARDVGGAARDARAAAGRVPGADARGRGGGAPRRDLLRRIPDVSFAWAGGLEPGQGHYYRIQGSSFVVEYDNTQNGANHVHTVWRDFHGDFGRDLLKEHYAADHRTAFRPS